MAQGARRGEPSGGQGPNFNHYVLGNDQNWLSDFAQQGQNLDSQAAQLGLSGSYIGQTMADRATEAGQGFGARGTDVQGRRAPTTVYDPKMGYAQQSNQQGGAAQYSLAQQLQDFARAPQGPSAAQAQLRQGTNDALNAQLALARSGSGYGESANALSAAGFNSANAIANAGNQSAMLRAQEDQAYRQNQANLLGLSGQQLAAGRQGDLGLAQQLAQQGQFATESALQQGQQNDAFAQSLYGNQIAEQNLNMQANQFRQDQQQQALAFQQQNQGQQLNAAQAQQQGTMGYEGDLNDIYQTDMNHNIESRKLDMQKDKDRVSGVGQVIGSIAGAFLSDRRTKHRIRDVNLDQVFRDLGGDDDEPTPRARIPASELSELYAALAA